jgi:hypothetical protein
LGQAPDPRRRPLPPRRPLLRRPRGRHFGARALCLAGALGIAGGCATPLRIPDLGGIYNRSARHVDAGRNPIIVIPGILGSRLRDRETGRLVWGAFVADYANPARPDGARLLALPMREGAPLAELRDGVEADEVLDRVRVSLLRLPLEQKAYFHLLGALGAGGYRDQSLGLAGAIDYGDEHFTCFQFPYDWRRDNVESARRLHEFILEKRAYVQRELERRYGISRPDLRFDIVAHSMGGLVTRYYLEYGDADLPEDGPLPAPSWAGARHVERAILVGTPNAGSVQALVSLLEGQDFSWLLPGFPAPVLGTMPSLYQLLPRTRHRRALEGSQPLDLYDPALWERLGWGLAAPDADPVLERLLPSVADPAARRRIALDHLRKSLARAQRFQAALDAPATPPPGLSLHLIAGDSEPTDAAVAVEAGSGRVRVVAREPGDGTVPRSSAVLDERVGGEWTPELVTPIAWDRVTFLFQDHLGITRDPAFTDNLLFLLLEQPRVSGPASASEPGAGEPR